MDLVHGLTAYANGDCRCDKCRADWAEYHRNRRAAKRRSAMPASQEAYYPDRADTYKVKLSPLAARILQAAALRNRRDPDDVIEAALRCCGTRIHFDETAA